MAAQESPGAHLGGATGAGRPNYANAEGSLTIAQKPRAKEAATFYRVKPTEGQPFEVAVKGRTRWALDRLRMARERGCTPISQPAPRWSAYIFNLRELGVEIETIREPHEGDFPGSHGRYVLRSQVTPVRAGGAQ